MPNHTTTYEFYAETVVDYRDLPPQFTFQDIDSLFQLPQAHKNERPPSRLATRSTGKTNSVPNIVASLITFVSLLVLVLSVTVSAAKWITQHTARPNGSHNQWTVVPTCTWFGSLCSEGSELLEWGQRSIALSDSFGRATGTRRLTNVIRDATVLDTEFVLPVDRVAGLDGGRLFLCA
ncbi:hypothetical protein Ae201684_014563 [Aphanomyces euteiches]|uniref:Uncharacterized protein n=1 Tax=Aphanomyces euteiches TaxID=100861 RepID=A0A6G0WJ87_9STRA|nr:hypothetical protein Ae201684_014563 [Aphanomyces euteiches]